MRFNPKTTSFALVGSILSAIVLVFQISPALAVAPQGQSDNHRRFEVTFTKWVTGTNSSGFSLLGGFTGGDVAGDFAGEVLNRKVSTLIVAVGYVQPVEAQDARIVSAARLQNKV